jgi:hypothetical protein
MENFLMYPETGTEGYVQLGDVCVPAVNVQVYEDPPVIIDGHMYGNYFEVMFEDGSLWVVEQGLRDFPITITEYKEWYKVERGEMSMDQAESGKLNVTYWFNFLTAYKFKANR